jgi:fumarate hydratase subunit alpha
MTMREIQAADITATVSRLCREANYFLGDDVFQALERAYDSEPSPTGKEALRQIIENACIARDESVPICQDCGLAVVYMELGQDVRVVGGDLYKAIEEGVRQGYKEGYLRKSAVRQPYSARVNTKDNTPPIIHTEVVPGEHLKLTVVPKGGGSENMSAVRMLTPAAGRQGVIDFVVEAVDKAGSNPCPPIIVGVGIGGTFEWAAHLAKKSLLRTLGEPSPDTEVAELERDLLERINKLGIGPQGYGGRTTALAVHVETFPAHIASLPVAVNLQCHASRHKEATL